MSLGLMRLVPSSSVSLSATELPEENASNWGSGASGSLTISLHAGESLIQHGASWKQVVDRTA